MIKVRSVYAVIVEGKTKYWYLQMLKRNERNLRINIKPELPQKKTLEDQFELVKQEAEENSKVFWMIDLETKEAQKLPFYRAMKK